MVALDPTQCLILNAVSDDYEDLERIYRSVCMEVSPEAYNASDPGTFSWRESASKILLGELVEALRSLVEQGFLSVIDERGGPLDPPPDLAYLWRCWFGLSPRGREAHESVVRSTVSTATTLPIGRISPGRPASKD